MDRLMSILQDLRPDIDFEAEKELITGGVFDSMDIVALIDEINNEFGIEIKPKQILAENFDSVERIKVLIDSMIR